MLVIRGRTLEIKYDYFVMTVRYGKKRSNISSLYIPLTAMFDFMMFYFYPDLPSNSYPFDCRDELTTTRIVSGCKCCSSGYSHDTGVVLNAKTSIKDSDKIVMLISYRNSFNRKVRYQFTYNEFLKIRDYVLGAGCA